MAKRNAPLVLDQALNYIRNNATQEVACTGEPLTAYEGCDPAAWAASTAYSLGAAVRPTTRNTFAYEVTTAGTSGASQPTWPTTPGNTVVNGTVTWTCRTNRALAVAAMAPADDGGEVRRGCVPHGHRRSRGNHAARHHDDCAGVVLGHHLHSAVVDGWQHRQLPLVERRARGRGMTIDTRDQLIRALGNNHTRGLMDKVSSACVALVQLAAGTTTGIVRAAPKIAHG